MEANEKIKQIGYMPTTIEDEKINMIAKAYHLTRVNVIRNLIYNHITLDELFQHAKQIMARRGDDDWSNISDCIVGDSVII